jgi:hypothetical protein
MREIAEGKGEASYACHRAALRSRTSSSETVGIFESLSCHVTLEIYQRNVCVWTSR